MEGEGEGGEREGEREGRRGEGVREGREGKGGREREGGREIYNHQEDTLSERRCMQYQFPTYQLIYIQRRQIFYVYMI